MIDEALKLLKDRLNAHMRGHFVDAPEDNVVFLDGDKTDPVIFKLGAVTALLINLESEKTLRAADPHRQALADGKVARVQPEIRLNLYVLFVARYKQYEQSLRALSLIIQYFQLNPVLDHENTPTLVEGIDKLILELVTLPFSEQNEIWNALRTTYHPSALYKVKMLVYLDSSDEALPQIGEGKAFVDVHQIKPTKE